MTIYFPVISDGSGWSKVIPILTAAGHKVIAVQLPLHSLADDVATVKRAIDHIGGPVILVGHSYGGEVITNAGYNNPNVTGLVYIAAFAPDDGQGEFQSAKFPKGLLVTDSGVDSSLPIEEWSLSTQTQNYSEKILLRMFSMLRLKLWHPKPFNQSVISRAFRDDVFTILCVAFA